MGAKQIMARCHSKDGGYFDRLVPVDVLAQYGQWCITHPVMSLGEYALVDCERFTVTHELIGFCVPGSICFNKRFATKVAKALMPFELLSLQDPAWERDRREMGAVVKRIVDASHGQMPAAAGAEVSR